MSNLVTRAASGVVFIAIFLGAILFSKESYIILITIFGLISMFEFSKMIQLKSIVPYLLILGSGHFAYTNPNAEKTWIIVAITLLCSIRLLFYLFSEKENYPNHRFEKLDLAIRYIAFSFLFLVLLPFSSENYNPYIVIGVLIILWVNDSFAYLIGKNFGKRKLFERISPRKTIEGFIGGLVFSMISSVLLATYFSEFTILNWIIIAAIVSIFGTLGDLIESKFKRRAKVKDSGNIMPGHGGILDRLDSLIFAAPFVYLYIHYLI